VPATTRHRTGSSRIRQRSVSSALKYCAKYRTDLRDHVRERLLRRPSRRGTPAGMLTLRNYTPLAIGVLLRDSGSRVTKVVPVD